METLAPAATRREFCRQDGECRRRGRAPPARAWKMAKWKHRPVPFPLVLTPQVPHCWEASLLFEEPTAPLFCSDLFHQDGDVEPSTSADVVGRFRQTLVEYQQGPLAHDLPHPPYTEPTLQRLAGLKPRTLAAMTDRRSSVTAKPERPRAGHGRGTGGREPVSSNRRRASHRK